MESNIAPQRVLEFLDAFEEIFDRDWTYTKQMLGVHEETPAQEEASREMGLETMHVISPDGTFANPGIDNETEDWGNRGHLLDAYRTLKAEMGSPPPEARTHDTSPMFLIYTLSMALLANVFPDLRQASIAVDESSQLVRLRFEFDGEPSEDSWEACSCASTEVIASFVDGWMLEEEYLARPCPCALSPLDHIAFRRAEMPGASP